MILMQPLDCMLKVVVINSIEHRYECCEFIPSTDEVQNVYEVQDGIVIIIDGDKLIYCW
jgi:hypothetical protein